MQLDEGRYDARDIVPAILFVYWHLPILKTTAI